MEYARLPGKEIDYPRVNRAALLLFCIYVIIWYLQIGNRWTFLGEIRFEFIFAAFLSMVAILATDKRNLACPLYGIHCSFLYRLDHSNPFFL